ncbi:hypothetical protein BGZ76_002524 [Entomortierella beljakovae]|nr:hypothetical protein BGZ76_002524 [Entomortierella beljakovae]
MPPSTMNKILMNMPAPMAFYQKHVRRLILLVVLLNIKSLPGVFHAKMFLRIIAVQLYSIRHRQGFRIKPTDTSIVRERVWVDDLDLNFHFSNSSYGKNCDYARVKFVISLLGPSVLPLHPNRKIAFALGGNQMWFKKEITLFQSYEIRTRLLTWNQKWFILEHRMYTPARRNGNKEKEQQLCAIGISKFVLKYASGSWKGKTIPFLDALDMVGHDITELRALEAKSEDGSVVLWPKDELEFKSFTGWSSKGAAVGNGLDLCETMLLQN